MMNQDVRTVSDDPAVQAFFERLVRQGTSEQFAEMLALRQPPGTGKTDRAFLEGQHANHGLEPAEVERVLARARAAGIQTAGKKYVSSLADKRGPADPDAWVMGLDDVAATCRKRGYGCEPLGIKAREPQPFRQVRLSERIIRDEIERRLEEDPECCSTPQKLADLRHEIIERHGQKPEESGLMMKAD